MFSLILLMIPSRAARAFTSAVRALIRGRFALRAKGDVDHFDNSFIVMRVPRNWCIW